MFERGVKWFERNKRMIVIGNVIGPLAGFFADYGVVSIRPVSPYQEINKIIESEIDLGELTPIPSDIFSKSISLEKKKEIYTETINVHVNTIINAAKSHFSFSLAGKIISKVEQKKRLNKLTVYLTNNLADWNNDEESFAAVWSTTNNLFTYILEGSQVTDLESSQDLTTSILRSAVRLNLTEKKQEKNPEIAI